MNRTMDTSAVAKVLSVVVTALALGLLAFSQMFVIHDHVAKVHKNWPWYAQWSMAGGFEAAIITVALASAITARRLRKGEHLDLAVAEGFLIAVSILAGFLVTLPTELPAWLSAVSMSLVPLQYVCVIFAMRRFYVYFSTPAPRGPERPQERRNDAPAVKDRPARPRRSKAAPGGSGRGRGAEPKMSAEDYAAAVNKARAAGEVPEGARPTTIDRIVAEALGVSPKTAGRHRPNGNGSA